MNVFVAGVSSEQQYVKSLKTLYAMKIEKGDRIRVESGLRGDVARELLCSEFMNSDYDAILMLDLDMLHPKDLLVKLREYNLPIVSGHYFKRTTGPMQSVVEYSSDKTWPYANLYNPPQRGLMKDVHGWPICNVGMGNVLIKREVIESVARELPANDHPFAIGPLPTISGDYRSFGTDFRFFAIALLLGYDIWVDFGIESLHGTTIWLSYKLYNKLRDVEAEAELAGKKRDLNMEVQGMNRKTQTIRVKEIELLQEHFDKQKPKSDLWELWETKVKPYFQDIIMWEFQMAVIHGQSEEAKNTLSRCPKSQFVKAGKMPGQKALYYRLTFLEWQMKELLEKMKEDPHQKWDNALRETEVRIKEVQDWLDIQESENEDWGKMVVGDDGRRRPEMPTFGSKEQVRDALTNKHLGMPHEDGTRSDEAEVKRQREGVHKREAERALEKMDGKNPYGK